MHTAVASPPAGVEISTRKDSSPTVVANGHVSNEDSTQLLQEQKQTIALLVSEKASLTEKLEQFDGIDIRTFMLRMFDEMFNAFTRTWRKEERIGTEISRSRCVTLGQGALGK